MVRYGVAQVSKFRPHLTKNLHDKMTCYPMGGALAVYVKEAVVICIFWIENLHPQYFFWVKKSVKYFFRS